MKLSLPAPVRLAVVGVAFLLSGAAALDYQVVWQRILALHTGMGVTSIAIIVAAFMAGLGLGSHAGGVWSSRVSPRTALGLFAAIEALIGAFASMSARLYYEVPQHYAWIYASPVGMSLAHFLALLVPTALMGLSLPFLTRAMVRDTATASRTIAVLYGVNTVGAGLGALLTPWVLIRFYGMERAILFGVAANLTAALVALLAGSAEASRQETPADGSVPAASSETFRPPLVLWMALYALSGFCALSLEILWFRLLDVAVKSTAFTFGTMLCGYLLGVGGGSLVGSLYAHRWPRPLSVFLRFQSLLLVYAALAVTLLARLPAGAPVYRWFFHYWGYEDFFKLGADWSLPFLGRLYVLLPLFLYGPPTILMGLSFAALQRAVHDDPRTSGRKVGFLQAANIAGCVTGSLLVGLVLLDHVGTTGALRILLALGLLFPIVRLWYDGRGLAWAGAIAIAFGVLPSQQLLWTKLHGVTDTTRTSFIGEDATAVSTVTPGRPASWRVTVNGLPHSWVPYQGIHTLLGSVPVLVHPMPLDVAVIGLGSGETAWAASCRSETRSVDVFEIAAAQPRLLMAVSRETAIGALTRFLHDPRVHIAAADGRVALLRSTKRYDVIQVDALFRTSAMSGNLYSVEFYKLCADRLKPGGLVSAEEMSRRTSLSLAEAVPYAIDLGGNIMIGSRDPLPIDAAAWTARLDPVVDYFGPAVADGIRDRLTRARRIRRNEDSRRGVNLDLFPRDELQTPVDTRSE